MEQSSLPLMGFRWVDEVHSVGDLYHQHNEQSRAWTERYRERLAQADPQVDRMGAFHLVGNWGNDAARRMLKRYRRGNHLLRVRYEAATRIAQHRCHIGRNEVGVYHWCDYCAGRRIWKES